MNEQPRVKDSIHKNWIVIVGNECHNNSFEEVGIDNHQEPFLHEMSDERMRHPVGTVQQTLVIRLQDIKH